MSAATLFGSLVSCTAVHVWPFEPVILGWQLGTLLNKLKQEAS